MPDASSIFLWFLLATLAVSGAVVAAGWRRRERRIACPEGADTLLAEAVFAAAKAGDASGKAAVGKGADGERVSGEMVLRAVLGSLTPLAARHFVSLDIAVQPDLAGAPELAGLREVIAALIADAIRATPGGHVLLTAIRRGRRIEVRISDDGAGLDESTRMATSREANQRLALLGGSVWTESGPGQGTKVMLRLPIAAEPTDELAETATRFDPAAADQLHHHLAVQSSRRLTAAMALAPRGPGCVASSLFDDQAGSHGQPFSGRLSS